ncbi:hypothetical protein [Shinella fusca]|uniref:Uncharacterized protein n=1 Tax=Shinella fusca TaxID=544480 RepID=A0A7W7YT70_9HYPH|nr:hypothetical protein [Shinella fusca]MBB5041948.1 hypothetical protein [Shinella fusca]
MKRRTGPGQLSLEVADRMAPTNPKYQGRHYRSCLAEAHTIIEAFRLRITELEDSLERLKRDCDYRLSLCVTRTAAEEERQRAAAWMREKAASIVEGDEGIPTVMSYAIDCIPNPKPKFCTQEQLDERLAQQS